MPTLHYRGLDAVAAYQGDHEAIMELIHQQPGKEEELLEFGRRILEIEPERMMTISLIRDEHGHPKEISVGL